MNADVDRRFVNYTVEEKVGWVTIDNPPLNTLNNALMDELKAVFEELEQNDDVLVVILRGGGDADNGRRDALGDVGD